MPTKAVLNRDAANAGPGPGEGVGRSIAICRKYNTNLCRHSDADCNHAHVCFHCVDWDDRHGSWACLASLETIEHLQAEDMLRAYRAP